MGLCWVYAGMVHNHGWGFWWYNIGDMIYRDGHQNARRRMERVNAIARDEISRIIASEMNDPRLASIISITEVQTSSDLRSAKVYFSVLGDEAAKRDALAAMRAAGGFIHRTMKRRKTLKYAPFLSFRLDDSIQQGVEMQRLIEWNAPRPPDREGGDA